VTLTLTTYYAASSVKDRPGRSYRAATFANVVGLGGTSSPNELTMRDDTTTERVTCFAPGSSCSLFGSIRNPACEPSTSTSGLQKCEFKATLTVRHDRKPIVLGEHRCARDRFVGHTVHHGAADALDCPVCVPNWMCPPENLLRFEPQCARFPGGAAPPGNSLGNLRAVRSDSRERTE
jgi:hypothetical protein